MCGFIGLLRSPHAVQEICDALVAIQHRGQDAAGIATYDGVFHLVKDEGLVRDVFDERAFAALQGTVGVGHVRYPTVGSGGREDAQPFFVTSPCGIVLAHNGNVANYRELRATLEGDGRHRLTSHCDAEVILYVFADALSEALPRDACTEGVARGDFLAAFDRAVGRVFERVKGAYSVAGLLEMPVPETSGRPARGAALFAFRDPHGIKPIVLGRREVEGLASYAAASESVVLDLLGFPERLAPPVGGAILVEPSGELHSFQAEAGAHSPCLFEFVYFARPDSQIDGVGVHRTRRRMGERLAEKFRRLGLTADVVVPVPDSARTAAVALAESLGVPYREGLVKNRYIARTFIMPDQEERRHSVRHKLNAIREEFEGKDVLLVDDSIVRGTTSRSTIAMARAAGARRVFLASTAPPLRHPCPYGIDMSTRREFLAQGLGEEEIARVLGADAVIYQELGDLRGAVLEANPGLPTTCDGCFTGCYPTGDITDEMLRTIEDERLAKERVRQRDLPFFPGRRRRREGGETP